MNKEIKTLREKYVIHWIIHVFAVVLCILLIVFPWVYIEYIKKTINNPVVIPYFDMFYYILPVYNVLFLFFLIKAVIVIVNLCKDYKNYKENNYIEAQVKLIKKTRFYIDLNQSLVNEYRYTFIDLETNKKFYLNVSGKCEVNHDYQIIYFKHSKRGVIVAMLEDIEEEK